MNGAITDFKKITEQTIHYLKDDLKSIRTGRASPALIEGLSVKTYGGQTTLKLMELATITTEDSSSLSIRPFDPSTQTDIEKSILKSELGLSPAIQDNAIIVKIPPLSQEQRGKYLKLLGQKIEERRIILRNHRDEARRKIKNQMEQKEINEDQKFRLEKEVDQITQNVMNQIQELREIKEKEITQL